MPQAKARQEAGNCHWLPMPLSLPRSSNGDRILLGSLQSPGCSAPASPAHGASGGPAGGGDPLGLVLSYWGQPMAGWGQPLPISEQTASAQWGVGRLYGASCLLALSDYCITHLQLSPICSEYVGQG